MQPGSLNYTYQLKARIILTHNGEDLYDFMSHFIFTVIETLQEHQMSCDPYVASTVALNSRCVAAFRFAVCRGFVQKVFHALPHQTVEWCRGE